MTRKILMTYGTLQGTITQTWQRQQHWIFYHRIHRNSPMRFTASRLKKKRNFPLFLNTSLNWTEKGLQHALKYQRARWITTAIWIHQKSRNNKKVASLIQMQWDKRQWILHWDVHPQAIVHLLLSRCMMKFLHLAYKVKVWEKHFFYGHNNSNGPPNIYGDPEALAQTGAWVGWNWFLLSTSQQVTIFRFVPRVQEQSRFTYHTMVRRRFYCPNRSVLLHYKSWVSEMCYRTFWLSRVSGFSRFQGIEMSTAAKDGSRLSSCKPKQQQTILAVRQYILALKGSAALHEVIDIKGVQPTLTFSTVQETTPQERFNCYSRFMKAKRKSCLGGA